MPGIWNPAKVDGLETDRDYVVGYGRDINVGMPHLSAWRRPTRGRGRQRARQTWGRGAGHAHWLEDLARFDNNHIGCT